MGSEKAGVDPGLLEQCHEILFYPHVWIEELI